MRTTFSYVRSFIGAVLIFFLVPAIVPSASSSLYAQQIPDSLSSLISRANTAWTEDRGDLDLASDLLSGVMRHTAYSYYNLATTFYMFSLRNSSFATDSAAVTRETRRMIPLVEDSLKSRWRRHLDRENDTLLAEIYGFWEREDPYASTETNERLLEHWKRINFAREHYTRTSDSPYGTDDRGTFYVRLGAPDRTIQRTLQINQVMDPGWAGMFRFEMGNLIQSDVIIWEYSEPEGGFYLLFGKRNGWGEFGLRNGLLDVLDTEGMRVEIRGGNFLSDADMRDFTEQVILVGALEQLAPDLDYFERLYSQVRNRLSTNTSTSQVAAMNRYDQAMYFVEPAIRHRMYENLQKISGSHTWVTDEESELPVQHRMFRLLGENDSTQYILAVKAAPGPAHTNYDAYYLANRVTLYDRTWTLAANIDDPARIQASDLPLISMYRLEQQHRNLHLYYSSELIDTTRSNVFHPGKINPRASSIVATSGRQHVDFPVPLDAGQPLLVSDIVLGFEQTGEYDVRVPITPAMDYRFQQGSRLMVFFEVYNIPESGYSVTYHFERKRWLLGNRRVADKPEVTLNNEEIPSRHMQVFSLPLTDLRPGDYEIVFRFRPVNSPGEEAAREKRIDITILE